MAVDYGPNAAGERQDLQLQQLSSGIASRAENSSGLDKFLNAINLFNIPKKAAYNFLASQNNLPTVSYNPAVGINLTDIAQLSNPSLMSDAAFQGRKGTYDFLDQTFLDPANLLGGGKTAVGIGLKSLEDLGLATKTLTSGEKALVATKDILDAPGKNILFKTGDTVAPEAIAKALPETGDLLKKSNVLDSAGKVVGDITPGLDLAGQIRQGTTGVRWAGLPIGGKELQAKTVEAIAGGYNKILDQFPALKSWMTTEKSSLKNADNILPGTMDLANKVLHPESDLHMNLGAAKTIQKGEKDLYPSFYEARAQRLGTTADAVKASMNGGLDDESKMALASLVEKSKKETPESIIAQGGLKSDRLKLNPAGKTLEDTAQTVDHIVPVDPGLMQDLKSSGLADYALVAPAERNVARSAERQAATENAKFLKVAGPTTMEDYIKGISKSNLTAKAIDKVSGQATFFGKISKAIAGNRQTYRGGSIAERNQLQHIRDTVLGGNFTLAQKVAAIMLRNSRHLGNTMGDVLKTGAKTNLQDLIAQAKEAGDIGKADALTGAGELRKNFNAIFKNSELTKDLTGKEKRALINEIRKVDLGQLADDAGQTVSKNYYHLGLAPTDYVSSMEVAQHTAAVNFWDKTFERGLNSGVVKPVALGDEVPKGFHRLDDIKFSDVPDEVASKFAENYQAGKNYVYAMSDGLYNNLKETGAFKMIQNPTEGLPKGVLESAFSSLKTISSLWKTSTLAFIPSYYTRNFLADIIKMTFEGPGLDFDARSGSLAALGKWSDLDGFRKVSGNAPAWSMKTPTGHVLDDKQILKEAYDNGVMGHGYGPIGLSSSKESVEKTLRNAGLIQGSEIEAAKQFDNVVAAAGSKGEELLDKMRRMMKLQEHIEATNRLTSYIHFRRTMSAEQAAARTKLVHYDYDNATKIEKELFQQVFPFYSFKKGVSKYLATRMLTDYGKLKMILSAPGAWNDVIFPSLNGENHKVNRGILPSYLNDSSIQLGNNEDGSPRIVNLKGWNDYAEISDFIKPWDAAGSLLSPFIKKPYELIANMDTFFDKPIEQYPGQKSNVLGVPVDRRGFVKAVFDEIRPLKVAQQGIETLLKTADSKYSVFGTKEKPSWFGLGATDKVNNPAPLSDYLWKNIGGVPVTTVDVDRERQNLAYQLEDQIRQFRSTVKRIGKDYPNDPKTREKEIASRVATLQDQIERFNNRHVESSFGR